MLAVYILVKRVIRDTVDFEKTRINIISVNDIHN